ncbi:MAG: hypothetical protein ACRD40_01385, partial [Candidatus Acidiferrales bacterium]
SEAKDPSCCSSLLQFAFAVRFCSSLLQFAFAVRSTFPSLQFSTVGVTRARHVKRRRECTELALEDFLHLSAFYLHLTAVLVITS